MSCHGPHTRSQSTYAQERHSSFIPTRRQVPPPPRHPDLATTPCPMMAINASTAVSSPDLAIYNGVIHFNSDHNLAHSPRPSCGTYHRQQSSATNTHTSPFASSSANSFAAPRRPAIPLRSLFATSTGLGDREEALRLPQARHRVQNLVDHLPNSTSNSFPYHVRLGSGQLSLRLRREGQE